MFTLHSLITSGLLLMLLVFLAMISAPISTSMGWHSLFSSMMLSLDQNKQNINFLMIITVVSTMIFIYSHFYMGYTKDMNTFSSVLLTFVFSMLFLVISDSFMMYLLGWDGLGVSSFLLVIYYSSLLATRSGLATFITNRIGDFFIILSFVLLMSCKQDFYVTGLDLMNKNTSNMMKIFFILLMCGAFTKSAQIPFSAWLPAAMAAPTPVSALVHSSTLVTAGLFIMSKFFLMVDITTNLSLWLCVSCVTLSFLSGLMAYFETDLKKLVAMSTLSQMGLIGYALFVLEQEICAFHMYSHATFKSLLFIVVGSLMFFNVGFQDVRVKSKPVSMMKIPMVLLICSSLSLMGFFFTSGFFSKDLIILTYPSGMINSTIFLIMIMSCVLTAAYTMKSFGILVMSMQTSPLDASESKNVSLWSSASGLFFFTLFFGIYYFNENILSESYEIEQINKTMGIFIMLTGLLLTRTSWNPTLKNISDPTTMNNKDLKTYFMQMTNLNWISNNFMTYYSKFKNVTLYEPLWWTFLSENKMGNSLIMTKDLEQKEHGSHKVLIPNYYLQNLMFFLFFMGFLAIFFVPLLF